MSERVRDGEKGRDLGKLEKGSKKGKKESHLSSEGCHDKRNGVILCHVAGCWGAVHSSGVRKTCVFWVALTFAASQERMEEGESQGTGLLLSPLKVS